MLDQKSIRETADRLIKAAPAGSGVILFGSYARGDANNNSDLDFLVVEPQLSDRHAEMVRLRHALRGARIGIDILVTSQQVFDDWKHTPNNILYFAWKEGRVYSEMG